MTNARDIYTPRYQIKINREILLEEVTQFITDIEYEDNSLMMDKITLSIGTQIIVDEGLVISMLGSKLFSEGNLIELFMGYGSNLNFIGAGEIVRVEPNFPRNDTPTLTIIAYDVLHRLTGRNKESENGKSYPKQKDSTTVEEIAQRNSLKIGSIIDTKNKQNRVQSKGQSDYNFLIKLAENNGYELYVRYDNNKWLLYFHPSLDQYRPMYTYKYNVGEKTIENTLLEFTPNMNIHDQPTEFEIIGWDRITNKKIKGVSRDKDFKFESETGEYSYDVLNNRKFAGNKKTEQITESIKEPGSIRFSAFGKNREIILDTSIDSEDKARTKILAWIKERKKHFITGSGFIIGNEYLQSRQSFILEGIGDALSGKYYLTTVTHKMGQNSNYECEFKCNKVVE